MQFHILWLYIKYNCLFVRFSIIICFELWYITLNTVYWNLCKLFVDFECRSLALENTSIICNLCFEFFHFQPKRIYLFNLLNNIEKSRMPESSWFGRIQSAVLTFIQMKKALRIDRYDQFGSSRLDYRTECCDEKKYWLYRLLFILTGNVTLQGNKTDLCTFSNTWRISHHLQSSWETRTKHFIDNRML